MIWVFCPCQWWVSHKKSLDEEWVGEWAQSKFFGGIFGIFKTLQSPLAKHLPDKVLRQHSFPVLGNSNIEHWAAPRSLARSYRAVRCCTIGPSGSDMNIYSKVPSIPVVPHELAMHQQWKHMHAFGLHSRGAYYLAGGGKQFFVIMIAD